MFHSGIWAHATYSILRPVPQSVDLNGATRARHPGDPGTEGPVHQPGPAVYRAGLSLHRDLRAVPTLDGAEVHAFLCLLPGLVRAVRFQYTGELALMDHRLGQHGGAGAAACTLPALCGQLLGQLRLGASATGSAGDLVCALLYVPGILLLGLQYTAIRYWSATEVLLHRLDQISLGYLALYYVIAAIVFRFRYRSAESALERQQLKWLTRGTLLAVTPFTLLYVIPYLADCADAGLADQARRTLAGHPSADLQLGHCALPADGRRPDLQARRDLHAGYGVAGGTLLRRRRGDRRSLSTRACRALASGA